MKVALQQSVGVLKFLLFPCYCPALRMLFDGSFRYVLCTFQNSYLLPPLCTQKKGLNRTQSCVLLKLILIWFMRYYVKSLSYKYSIGKGIKKKIGNNL